MNEAVVSGSFAIIGTSLGWVLSEVGAGWRDLVQRRRTEQADATARVLDTARAAVAVCEGIRWLIQVDVAKKLIGEGIGTKEYTVKAVDLADQVQQTRLLLLAITARGPRSAVPQVYELATRVQALWDVFCVTTRAEIAAEPARLLSACDEVAKIAQELVGLPAM
jgi:hypothetical protein